MLVHWNQIHTYFKAFLFAIVLSIAGSQNLFCAEMTNTEIKAKPFSLHDVRLLEGQFKIAQSLAAEYLLELEPDRFLANFRKEAGLEPKAEHYGGWESMEISGHCGGHFLSGCAMAWASTGDERFLERVNYFVDELEECQNADGEGYIGAIPNGKSVYEDISKGIITSGGFDLNGLWVPNYNIHKLFAGLRDAYHLAGNQKALEIEKKLADWFEKIHANLSEDQMQKILAAEHGGINETFADLYADTGDERYLALSKKFHHKAILDPLSKGEDILPGKHANTQIPKLVGLARRYELTGNETDKFTAEFFWDRVVNHHSYVTGGHCDHEHFGQPDKLNDRLTPASTETCNVYNMLKLTKHIFSWKPEAKVYDFYERALFNHMRATQHPDGRVIYNLSLKPGHYKEYQRKFDGFTCCVGTGMENHVKYGDAIYFHSDDKLWVNLFISSEVEWKDKGITLRQETLFPERDTSKITIHTESPKRFALLIRHPYWATEGINIALNGKTIVTKSNPSSYVEIEMEWNDGDEIEVTMPMSLRTESMPDNTNRIAIFFGPTLLAAELGPVAKQPLEGFENQVLLTSSNDISNWVEPIADEPLTFHTVDVGKPSDVRLIPFYSLHDRRYTVYMDKYTESEWKKEQERVLAEQERLRELERITVDVFQPGEMQPERNHNVKSEESGTGEAFGKKFRHAFNGGWFSFEMKVEEGKTNKLVCTYWGSDSGNRVFDILIDGEKIAEQILQNNQPDRFYDEVYVIPNKLIEGRDKVTVKLQAHPNNYAGGLFGVRIIKD